MTTRSEDLQLTIFECGNGCGDPITFAERKGFLPAWLHVSYPTNDHGPILFIHCDSMGTRVAHPSAHDQGAAVFRRRFLDDLDKQAAAALVDSLVEANEIAEVRALDQAIEATAEVADIEQVTDSEIWETGTDDTDDPIKRPSHYRIVLADGSEIDPIDIIEALGLDFHTGNALKYIVRGGRKPDGNMIEDYEKARYYLARRIEYLTNADLETDGK